MKKPSIDELNKLLEEKSEYELSDISINKSSAKLGTNHSEQTKQKISERRSGKCAWNKGIEQTPEQKTKISLSLIGNTCALGKKKKKSACLKMSESKKKKCTVDGVVFFDSYLDLVETLGRGKNGSRHPNFRYVTKEEYEAYLKAKH